MQLRPPRVALAALIALALVAGCLPQPTPEPTPTRTPAAGDLTPRSFSTAIPHATVAPTVPPPTPIPNADYPVGPESYPADINPLTGLPVDDPAVLARAPLAVKVSNAFSANPHSGLSSADQVWEHYAEGAETRYTAIYYSQSPDYVGSVRSGRLIDLEIVPMFDAIFTASGFSGGMLKRVEDSSWVDRNFSGPEIGEPYLTRLDIENVDREHTLFAVPEQLWRLAEQQGVNNPPNLAPGLAFDTTPPTNGTPATTVQIDFGLSYTEVQWDYDPATRLYTRTLGRDLHIDRLTDQPITAANVLAVGAWHIESDFIEDGARGLLSVEIQLWGEGPASLFRDGQRIEGMWRRDNPELMLQFTDLDGNIMYLRPGTTWFEVVPIGFDALYTEP